MVYKPYYCLIVTPSKTLASVIGTHLESLGWKLVIARDSSEATLKLQNQPFDFLVVVGLEHEKACLVLKNAVQLFQQMKVWFFMDRQHKLEEALIQSGNVMVMILPEPEKNLKSNIEALFLKRIPQKEFSSSKLIYIVDDNQLNREVLQGMLKAMSCDSQSFSTGKEVLDALEVKVPDLILLDFIMPDINGDIVLAKIRESQSKEDLPVIVISAQEDRTKIVQLIQSGVNDYIVKPVDFEKLRDKFKKMNLLS